MIDHPNACPPEPNDASGYFLQPGYAKAPGLLPTSGQPRVLLVEDEDDLRFLLRRVLEKRLGADVIMAVDGLDGVRHLRDKEFSLIVSDVQMPRLNGVAFWDWTRTNRPEQAERFLFITGDPGSTENHRRLRESQRTVLAKPFGLDDFETQCRRILEQSNALQLS